VGQDGTFRIDGIEPGTYLLEVHSIDMDPLNPDFDAIMSMDRSPRIRQEIVVGTEPVHLTLEVPPR